MAYPYYKDPVKCLLNQYRLDSGWNEGGETLYMELRFLRTFFRSAAKWCNNEHAELNHLLTHLQTLITNTRTDLHSRFCVTYKSGENVIYSDVLGKIHLLKPQIHQVLQDSLYFPLDSSLNFESVREFIRFLIENCCDALKFQKDLTALQNESVKLVQEKLKYLDDFLFFVSKWSVRQEKLQPILNHIEALADIATTYVSFPCLSITSDKDMNSGMFFDRLIQTIKPIKPEVIKTYLHVLKALIPPGSYSYLTPEFVACFVDFLLQDLNEMLESQTSTLLVPVKDCFETLHRELRLILTFLISPPEQPTELGKIDDISAVIEATVMETVSVVHRFRNQEMDEDSAKELEAAVICLLKMVDPAKTKSGEIYLNIGKLPREPSFPKIDMLGFMDSLFESVQQLMDLKIDSIALVKHQVETVSQELEFFKSFFKDVSDHENLDEDDELNVLSTHVIHLAYRIEYLIDSLLVRPSPLWRRLLEDVILETVFVKAHILENFDKETSALRNHKSPNISTRAPSEESSSLLDEEFVGLEDEAQTIVTKLIKGPGELDIISIVGMPGLGKTTLAKKVFNDESVSQRFQVRAWCCVSQLYQKKELLLELLCQFVEDTYKINKMDEQELAQELKKRLRRRRYLIVTDDMWKTNVWDDLKMCFPDDSNGSRIIITTRLDEVAVYAKQCSEPHYLRFLSKEESWNLLQKKLFHEGSCPTELLEIGKEISEKCQGLPLFIVLAGGILGNMDAQLNSRIEDKEISWKHLADSLNSKLVRDGEHNWMDILELSYKHLPNHLKSCFLYFGAFLEDQEIPVSKLIVLWISEGFVQKSESKKQEDIAQEYLVDLIGRNLVMVAKRRSIGGVKSCRVHDLLHKFCLEKAEEESLLQVMISKFEEQSFPHYDILFGFVPIIDPPRTPIIYEQRRVRINCDQRQFVLSRPSGPTVRSILFHATRRGFRGESFNISFVGHNFKLLRVLDLDRIRMGDQFAEEISLLVHLRFLAVRGGMRSIPSSIVMLWNLETLLVKGEKGEISLPDTIFQMKRLRNVHINGPVTFPLTSSQLDNLITFSTPSLCFSFDRNKMRSFPSIQKLRCKFLEQWSYFYDLKKSCNRFPVLGFLNQLESLKVIYQGRVLSPCEFSFPSNLKKLTLSKFRLPWSEISAISKLENLEVLKLVFRAFEGDHWDVNDVEFKRLKFLKLDFLNIAQWNVSDDAFPSLECLLLQKCKRLEEIPSAFGYSASLQMIQVQWCSSAAAKSAAEIKETQVDELGKYNFNASIQQQDGDLSP